MQELSTSQNFSNIQLELLKLYSTVVKENELIGEQLQKDLYRLNIAVIPVDIVFEQVKEVLGL